MSDQNTTTTNQATDQATVDAAPVKVYATRADCESNKPADAPKGMRPFEVTKAGTVVGWINGRGYDHCLAQLARLDGYTVSTGHSAPVTKQAVLAKLAEFTDAELAALGLSRKPQATPAPKQGGKSK